MRFVKEVLHELYKRENKIKALSARAYFKDYNPYDKWLGVQVKQISLLVSRYLNLMNLSRLQILIDNPYHEVRYFVLETLNRLYAQEKTNMGREQIMDFYLKNKIYINNWDLVDKISYQIVGAYVFETQQTDILFSLSKEESIWSNRMSIVSTLYFVKNNSFDISKQIISNKLCCPHHLIQMVNGWVLKEIGRKDEKYLIEFIDNYLEQINVDVVLFATKGIEKEKRKFYLKWAKEKQYASKNK